MDQVSTLNNIKEEKPLTICFLGGAAWKENDEPYIQAFETAKLLAENGYQIVDGGGPGVMEAATNGAHAGGAKVLAVTYHPNKPKRHYEGVSKDNNFDFEVVTLDYFDRTKVILQTTDIHIIFKGSIGTMSELGMTWVSSWIHEPDSKPIILYGKSWKKLLDAIDDVITTELGERELLKICTTPQEVLNYVREFEKKIRVKPV